MLSQKARYALHALIVLAEHAGEEPMQIADVAKTARVPRSNGWPIGSPESVRQTIAGEIQWNIWRRTVEISKARTTFSWLAFRAKAFVAHS